MEFLRITKYQQQKNKFQTSTMSYSKKKYSKILTSMIACIMIISLSPKIAMAQKTDFTGVWTRDTEKCQLGDGLSINSIPVELTVKQNSSQLEITRIAKNKDGVSLTYTEKPNFNGSSSIAFVKPDLNKKALITWSTNHELVLTADYTDDQGKPAQKIKETWVLSDDGKSLVIKAVLEVNGQEYPMLEVFDKK